MRDGPERVGRRGIEGALGRIKVQCPLPNDCPCQEEEPYASQERTGPEMLAGALLHPCNFHTIATGIRPSLSSCGFGHVEVTGVTCLGEGAEGEGEQVKARGTA